MDTVASVIITHGTTTMIIMIMIIYMTNIILINPDIYEELVKVQESKQSTMLNNLNKMMKQ